MEASKISKPKKPRKRKPRKHTVIFGKTRNMHENSLKNLKLFKKGQSGNPKGNTAGYICSRTILKRLLTANISVINNQGKKEDKPAGEVLLQRLVANAIDERRSATEQIRAAEAVLNRVEGKAIQPISYPEGIPTTPPILNIMPVTSTDNITTEPQDTDDNDHIDN